MNPIIFEKTDTVFNTNGLGRIYPISCKVTEERNGEYELEAVVPITDKHFSDIIPERILVVPHDDTGGLQAFRIYKVSKTLSGRFTIYAHHISYQLSKIPVHPFSAASCGQAVTGLGTNAAVPCPFNFSSYKTASGNFTVPYPKSIRSLLFGSEGSILDVYGGGDYEFDNWNVILHERRGADTGITVRYGRDITDGELTDSTEDVWTGIYPYWYGQVNGVDALVTLSEKIRNVTNPVSTPSPYIIPVDFSSDFENAPTEAQLRARASQYISRNAKTAVPKQYRIKFEALYKTEEYQSASALQRLTMGDGVQVYIPPLGISYTARVVRTVYDVLAEKYESIDIGDAREKLGNLLK